MSEQDDRYENGAFKYSSLLRMSRFSFYRAVEILRLNGLQSFAFMYDEMDRFLQDHRKMPKLAAYTAIFYCAFENSIKPSMHDQFYMDVLDELRSAYGLEGPIDEYAGSYVDELNVIKEHMNSIKNEYLY